jgi:hypothetical protein
MDPELDRFKRLSLCEYAATRGYSLVRGESTRGGGWRGSTTASLLMRHPATDDKIVIRVDRDGHWTYFSVRDERDNGTIIDFVQRRDGIDLPAIRNELRAWSGEPRTLRLPDHLRPNVTGPRDRTAVRDAFERGSLSSNSRYLNSRGIRPETLSCARFVGTWRIDRSDNLLFPHRDQDGVCGFERKGARVAGFVAGGVKTIWISNAREDDAKLVITEAVIDAFSHYQLELDPRARYASTAGAFGARQSQHLASAIVRLPEGASVVVATDNDAAGDQLAAKIAVHAGDRPVVRHPPPIGKDWNECLQRRERDYIRSLGVRGPGLGR